MFPKLERTKFDYINRGIITAYYILIMFVLNSLIGNLLSLLPIKDENTLIVIFEWVMYIILAVPVVLLSISELKESAKAYEDKSVGKIIGIICAGIGLTYAGSVIGSTISQSIAGSGTTSENESLIDAILATKPGIALIIVICVIGPIAEELVFRGGVQKLLHVVKVPPFLAILITAILFGLIHVVDAGDYEQIFPYLLTGMALGFTYYKSKSIYSCTVVHIFINCTSIFMTYIYMIIEKIMPDDLTELIGVITRLWIK